MSNMFHKVNQERKLLAKELSRVKEYCDKIEIYLSRLDGSRNLVLKIEKLQQQIQRLKDEESSFQSKINLRDEKIFKLETELDVFKHALKKNSNEIMNNLSKSNFQESAIDNSFSISEMNGFQDIHSIISMFSELGERRADSHALSLAVAQATRELEIVREESIKKGHELITLHERCRELSEQIHDRQVEVNTSRNNENYLEEINAKLMEEIGYLRLLVSDFHNQLHRADETANESEKSEEHYVSALDSLRHREIDAKYQLEQAQRRISDLEDTLSKSSQQLQHEVSHSEDLKSQLNEKNHFISLLQQQLSLLTQSLEEATNTKGIVMQAWGRGNHSIFPAGDLTAIEDTSMYATEHSITMSGGGGRNHDHQKLKDERDRAVRALHQVIKISKDLSMQLQRERQSSAQLRAQLIQHNDTKTELHGHRTESQRINDPVADSSEHRNVYMSASPDASRTMSIHSHTSYSAPQQQTYTRAGIGYQAKHSFPAPSSERAHVTQDTATLQSYRTPFSGDSTVSSQRLVRSRSNETLTSTRRRLSPSASSLVDISPMRPLTEGRLSEGGLEQQEDSPPPPSNIITDIIRYDNLVF